MKASSLINSLFGWFRVAGFGLLAIFALGGCVTTGGGGTVTPATTGALSVSLGYGPGTSGPYSTPYLCNGAGGTVTISSASGATQSQGYSFSGISDKDGCTTGVTFGNLQPGTWTIQNSPSSVTCQKQVTAGVGVTTSATIRTDVRTCQ